MKSRKDRSVETGEFITFIKKPLKRVAKHKDKEGVFLVLVDERDGVQYVAPDYFIEAEPSYEGLPLEDQMSYSSVWELI